MSSQGNKADAVSLDAGDVYSAVRLYNLAVVAKEQHAEGNILFSELCKCRRLKPET